MHASSFTRAFLLLFSGPIIWAVHFLFVYGFTGLACARGFADVEWLGIDIVLWVIAAATLAAVVGIALMFFRTVPKGTARDSAHFIHWVAVALGILSAIAILWETMPALIVPVCG